MRRYIALLFLSPAGDRRRSFAPREHFHDVRVAALLGLIQRRVPIDVLEVRLSVTFQQSLADVRSVVGGSLGVEWEGTAEWLWYVYIVKKEEAHGPLHSA